MATLPLAPLPSIVSSSSYSSSVRYSTFLAFRASAAEPSGPILASRYLHPQRREFLKGIALQALPLLFLKDSSPSFAKEVEVGSYFPPSPSDPSFVLFKASPKDTLALRAVLCRERAALSVYPSSNFEADTRTNILSGNYCQPKCAEPWVEVKFEDDKQGKVQVVASPLIRLTNKPKCIH